jgi:hypothetical protein
LERTPQLKPPKNDIASESHHKSGSEGFFSKLLGFVRQ